MLCFTNIKVGKLKSIIPKGERVEDVRSHLMEKLQITSCSVVEDLDVEYSGVISFGIGRSQPLMKVSLYS